MKRALNSLLTLYPIPFTAILGAPAFPRDMAGADRRHLTPFIIRREIPQQYSSNLPGLSCPPRYLVCSWLGEERIHSLLHGIAFVLLVAAFVVLSAGSMFCANGIVVSLKEEVRIQSDSMSLKDVAELSGPDASQIKSLAQISLGPSPEFGKAKILYQHQIGVLVQDALGLLPNLSLTGAPAVQIRRQGRPIDPNEIIPLLKSFLLETTDWKESEIEIRSLGNLKGMELPLGEVQVRYSSSAAITGNRTLLVPIEIVQEGKVLHSLWVTANVVIHSKILVAAKRIPLGKTIGPEDVAESSIEIPNIRSVYARSLEDVLNKASRRSFLAGDSLTIDSFTNPIIVKNGEAVQLRLERNGIVLTSLGRAEQDGKLGQIIRVRNPDFSKVLKAQVTGKAQVALQ
jgi:flagella basal body P-ring formation protein FlgA